MDMLLGALPASAPLPLPPDMAAWFARNQLYAKQTWWLVSSFILLVAVGQFVSCVATKAFASSATIPSSTDAERQGSGARPRKRDWSRLPLALVNYFRVIAFRHTVDVSKSISVTYAEAFITAGYIIAILTWELINTTDIAGTMFSTRYWSSRAGTLAVSQFPLITVLGTKNNILAYITGVSYDKLNFLHRMTARVAFALLWIHAGGKLPFLPLAVFETRFIRIGLTTLVAITVVVIVAIRPLRARFYEFFFFIHFSMVLIVLVGGYIHADEAARHGPYILPCLFIWGADRVLRLFRLLYFNNHLYAPGPSSHGDGLKASVELLSPKFVKLRLTRPSHFKWTPGQAAFLIMPGVSRIPFEAHPFTIASVDSRYRLNGALKGGLASTESLEDKPATAPPGGDVLPYWEEVDFFINVRDGFTKRLAGAAMKGEKVSVYLDGPYGFSPNLKNDDTVVLVAGGSGVSLAISTFLGIVSDVQNGNSRCRKLVFIWTIRDPNQILWISEALINALECAPFWLQISIRIFITSREKLSQTSLMTSEASKMLTAFPSVQIASGRPNIQKMLQDDVAGATGRLSVTVCGSAAIAKSCREALRLPFSTTLDGGPSVVLHVESFGYA